MSFLGRDFNSDQNYSDRLLMKLIKKCNDIVNEQYERTRQILTEKRDLLDLIAETLMETRNIKWKSKSNIYVIMVTLPESQNDGSDGRNSGTSEATNTSNRLTVEKAGYYQQSIKKYS